MERLFFVLWILFFPLGLKAQSTTTTTTTTLPLEARLTSTSGSVVLTGSTIQLTGSALNNPNSQTVSYNWSFVKKPTSSEASFSTPSPSEPQFVADKPGVYVVQLNINNDESTSEPAFLVFSVVDSVGTAVVPERVFSTPSLCALTFGFFGCDSVSHSFTATVGSDYILSVSNNSATSLSVVLNSETIINVPSNLEADRKFLIPVSLLAANELEVTVKGGVGSSVDIEIKRNTLPQDNNTVPVVADLNLVALNSRFVSGSLLVSDSDMDQSHTSELLLHLQNIYDRVLNNQISFSSGSFSYNAQVGFKGTEFFYFLTTDDGTPTKGVVSKAVVDVQYNTAPQLVSSQLVTVPKNSTSFVITPLALATDLENDSLTYSVVENPSQGTLSNCVNGPSGLSCQYTPPEGFTGTLSFTYKANDGTADSNISEVSLKVFSEDAFITKIESGRNHTCALFNEGNIRCWGQNNYGQLGLGHLNNIGDDETPLSQGDVDVGGKVIDISLGYDFSCALLETNEVKCWGQNNYGQLGIGRYGNIIQPDESVDFGFLSRIVDIQSGHNHVCVLFETGQARCWGRNDYGQLGYGFTKNIGNNEKPSGIGNIFIEFNHKIIGLSLGNSHTCALLDNNETKCWGYNNYGQLGLGNTNTIGDDELPSSFSSISLGGQVSSLGKGSGESFSCSILNTGQVKCWGYNNYGQLGLGNRKTIGDNELPSTITSINLGTARVKKISLGSGFACALLDNGDVKCWGQNNFGQLGVGNTDTIGDNEHPASQSAVNLPEDVVDISTGEDFACALLKSGSLKCWGQNNFGQLGLEHTNLIGDNETLQDIRSPNTGGESALVYPRFSFSPINPKISNQVSFSASESLAKNPIVSYAWDFGNGNTATGVSANQTFTSAGNHTVRLTLTDQLGNSQFQEKIVIVEPANGRPVMPGRQLFKTEKNKAVILSLKSGKAREGVTLSYSHVDSPSSGTLSECLNLNDVSGLSCKYTPTQDFVGTARFTYKTNDGTYDSINNAEVEIRVLEPRATVIKIASSQNHTCALYDNKKIKCWGYNYYGQLGYGHTFNIGDRRTVESQNFVNVGGDVLDIVMGANHTCVLLENKKIKCWGKNDFGQLGVERVGHIPRITSPLANPLELGFSVKQIASGGDTNCALGEQGQVKCWGFNGDGQLGIGNSDHWGDSEYETFEKLPFVALGKKAVKISVGRAYACAVLDNGSFKCWGVNNYGQLGYGHTNRIGDDELPSSINEVSLGTEIVDLFLGNNHTCALLSDKNAKCWGRNNNGQLGYGHTNNIGDNETLASLGTLDFTLDIEQLILGNNHTCALLSDRKLRCWGNGSELPQILGTSGNIASIAGSLVFDIDNIIMVSGLESGACFLVSSGDVRCWGRNNFGQLGLGHTQTIGDNEFISFPVNSVFPNQGNPLIARFNYLISNTNLKTVKFDASSSFFHGPSATYSWDFGDGTPVVSGKVVNHTFSQVGTYSVQLTVTNSLSQTDQVTKSIVIEPDDNPPFLVTEQKFSVIQGKTVILNLKTAQDFDSTSLTYSVVSNPSQGTLSNCSYSSSDVTCRYQAPTDFTGETSFTYKANDGTTDSNLSTVKLNILVSDPVILQLSAGDYHTCALYENKKIRCWGNNKSGQLGYSHTNDIGDDETPLSQGFVDVGANVIQISAGNLHTCALLEDKSVKCWGKNDSGQLGLSHTNNIGDNELPSTIGSIALGENVKKVISSFNFSCALTESGKVKCWGRNDYGQLGLSSSSNSVHTDLQFAQIGGRAINLFSNGPHVCALLKEGRVRCWGQNNYGQLGLGHTRTIGDDEHPFTANNVNVGQKVEDMAISSSHTCALLEDKSVKCWGSNNSGQLGLSDTSNNIGDNEFPSSISSTRFEVDAKKVVAGEDFTCSLLVNNDIRCWGDDFYLNDGFFNANLGDTLDIVAFSKHICALLKNGQTKCWGRNRDGQLGLGHRRGIIRVEKLPLVDNSQIGGGANHLISRFSYEAPTTSTINFDASSTYSTSSVSSYSWNFGDSTTGTGETTSHTYTSAGTYTVTLTVTDSLSQTDTFSQKIEIKMPNSSPFFLNSTQTFIVHQGETVSLSLSPGTDSEDTSSLTYTLVQSPANGTLSNCLEGTSDLTCDYTPDEDSTDDVTFTYKVNDGSLDSLEVTTVFLNVQSPRTPIIESSLAYNHTCVLFQGGKIKCWGLNDAGQLGYGHTINTIGKVETPASQDFIDLGANAVQISLGGHISCAILENGHIKCWGWNGDGRLGYGHINNIGDNEVLSSVSSVSLGEKVKQLSVGDTHACALLETGDVKCWGNNGSGQLGYGHTRTIGDNETLETLATLDLGGKVKKVIANKFSSCAIMEDGGLKCWGLNRFGQLGYGHTNDIGDNETLSNLVAISLPESVMDVRIQYRNTCVLFESGNAKCWGSRHSDIIGQTVFQNIGDNETPFALANLSFGALVDSLGLGNDHACALLETGDVKCWGENRDGQLGLGDPRKTTVAYVTNATAVSLGQNAVRLASGSDHICSLLVNGSLKCWGWNSSGQLGLGHTNTIGDDETPDNITPIGIGVEGLSPIARIKTNFALGIEDEAITFDASSSYSSDPTMETYAWDFGDDGTATTQVANHTFTDTGTYTVSLTITDENSNTHTVSKEIIILENLTSEEDEMRGPASDDDDDNDDEEEESQ